MENFSSLEFPENFASTYFAVTWKQGRIKTKWGNSFLKEKILRFY